MHQEKNGAEPSYDSAVRQAAAQDLNDGAVTVGYEADRQAIIAMLNQALATELVCVLRYKRHHYTLTGLHNGPIKAEFLAHALEEQGHADQIAARIVQLNGTPDFNPATLAARSHADYDESTHVQSMVKANLIAERIAIEVYRQMIRDIGDTDPTTRQMLVSIMAAEEEHADEMRDLLA